MSEAFADLQTFADLFLNAEFGIGLMFNIVFIMSLIAAIMIGKKQGFLSGCITFLMMPIAAVIVFVVSGNVFSWFFGETAVTFICAAFSVVLMGILWMRYDRNNNR